MKASELREKPPLELEKQVLETMRELFDLRMQKGIGETQMKSHHFRRLRIKMARIKTILTEKAKQNG